MEILNVLTRVRKSITANTLIFTKNVENGYKKEKGQIVLVCLADGVRVRLKNRMMIKFLTTLLDYVDIRTLRIDRMVIKMGVHNG